MFDVKVPKYSKIEIKIKGKVNQYEDGLKVSLPSTTVLTFEDAGLVITGNFIIVVIDEKHDINNTLSSTGQIFNLHEVISYRTHNE